MGDVIELRGPERIYPAVEETYRLVQAFAQIADQALREKIIALAEAEASKVVAPSRTCGRDGDASST